MQFEAMIVPLQLFIFAMVISLTIAKHFNVTLLNNRFHHSNELYVCKSFRVNSNRESFITAFKPYADNNTHHMILYGCSESDNDQLWDCGRFDAICANKQSKIIYAYALNADDLQLPQDVGFMVGGRSNINYLVLQIHLLNGDNKIYSTHYGIEISYEFRALTKFAGVYLMAGLGMIPHHEQTNIEIACRLRENIEIHPFAYRTHTHRLGKLVSGFRVRNQSEWTLIGERDPIATPQAFYPTEIDAADKVLRKNDILAARCVMKNTLDKDVYMGKTHNDEMCNFYLMYWTENRFIDENWCFFSDNDYFTKIGLENIPYSY